MKDLIDFCQKYGAQVKPTHKKWRRANAVPYSISSFRDPEIFNTTVQYSDIPIVSIEMPEDRFRALLEHDAWIEKVANNNQNLFQNSARGMYELTIQHQEECILRHQYPALQKAWEQYQTTLALCGGVRK